MITNKTVKVLQVFNNNGYQQVTLCPLKGWQMQSNNKLIQLHQTVFFLLLQSKQKPVTFLQGARDKLTQ